jgi:hypothetical protein
LTAMLLVTGCSSPQTNNTPPTGSIASPAQGFSQSNPASINTTVVFVEAVNDSGQGFADYAVRLTLLQVLRGPAAMEKMKHDIPYFMVNIAEGREFLLARFKYELIETDPPGASRLVNRGPFEVYRDNTFDPEDNKYVLGPLPDFYGKVKKGGSVDGWIVFSVPKDASRPLIVYDRYSTGTSSIWFMTV